MIFTQRILVGDLIALSFNGQITSTGLALEEDVKLNSIQNIAEHAPFFAPARCLPSTVPVFDKVRTSVHSARTSVHVQQFFGITALWYTRYWYLKTSWLDLNCGIRALFNF